MKRNLNVSFALAVAATLVLLIANPAYASNCNNATLTGNYGVLSPGFLTPPLPRQSTLGQDVAIAVVGVMMFDGMGGISDTHIRLPLTAGSSPAASAQGPIP